MINKSETIGLLALALSKAQGDMEGAIKDSKNPFFKSSYADLQSCIEAARKPLRDNELAVIQTLRSADGGVVIITTLAHSSGEWMESELLMRPKKDDDQGRGSSITYGRRYSYAAIVGLAQKDDDGNCSVKDDKKQESPGQESSRLRDSITNPDTEMLDKWLTYVDGFTKRNLDEFTAACDAHVDPAIEALSDKQANELFIAKTEMFKYLQEKEGKS